MTFRDDHPFDLLVQKPDREIRLAEAALLFAADHYPGLKPLPYLARLDALAKRAGSLGARTPADQAEALSVVLADEEGFRGNADDYYNPQNSFLNDVLDRRTGIPISLSAVWLDIAGQLDWPFHGIGLPGHFVIGHTEAPNLFVDPFSGGRTMERGECAALVQGMLGGHIEVPPETFAPSTTKQTLLRMLNNLRLIFVDQEEWRAAACIHLRLGALGLAGPVFDKERAYVAERLAERN